MTNINDKIETFELDTDQGKFYSKDHADKNLVLFFFLKLIPQDAQKRLYHLVT